MAAFEMDEIPYELKDHSAGLKCGRRDYIFSFIKKFAEHPACVLPDRSQVTMTTSFLRSYSLLLIDTCHHRGIHAMGGMAAQVPIRDDPESNEAAMAKVRADKEREVGDGHDGTWVAHPGLVPIAREIRHGAYLDDGRRVDPALCRTIEAEELGKLRRHDSGPDRYQDAADLFSSLTATTAFPPFLTLPAYDRIASEGS